MRRGTDWRLGWWAPLPPALEPDDVVDPTVHGALLSAVADGAPLDRLGQHRLDALKAAGLATADGRPRFPVARAAQAKAVVIELARAVTGREIPVNEEGRRPGDPAAPAAGPDEADLAALRCIPVAGPEDARLAFDHRIDRLEMTRIWRE